MVEKIMTTVKEFFRTRTVAFYVAAAAAVLSVILSIVYAACYSGTSYMSWGAFALTLIAGIAFFALAAFKQTEPFAALVLGVLNFIAFILFIHDVYMYFTTIFYGGFSAALLGDIDPAFYACTVLYLIIIVASNVCVYLKSSKTKSSENTQVETAEEAEQV